jgi:hypothetical protein
VKDIFKYKYTQSLGFSSSYRIQDSDSYDNVVSTFDVLGLNNSRLWLRGNSLADEIGRFQTSSYTVVSQSYKEDVRVAGRYNPFEAFNIYGRLSPVKTLTTNFTYTGSHEDTTSLGTNRVTNTTVWPDILLGLGQVEKMIWLERWVSNSQLNLKEQMRTSVTENYTSSNNSSYGADIRFMLLKKYDMSFSVANSFNNTLDLVQNLTTSSGYTSTWSGQGGVDFKPWRFILRYDNNQNVESDGSGKLTTDLLTQTYTLQIYSDMSFPKGLPIPFTSRKINLTNRFIFNTAIKYIDKSSSLNVTTDNTSTYSLTSSAEYEVSQNFRLSVGLGLTRMVNKEATGIDNNSYTEYDMNSRLTIQF